MKNYVKIEDVEFWQDRLKDQLAVSFKTNVFGQKRHQRYDVSVKVPASTWQYFKSKNFPDWLLAKYPIKTKEVTKSVEFDHYEIYPIADGLAKTAGGRYVFSMGGLGCQDFNAERDRAATGSYHREILIDFMHFQNEWEMAGIIDTDDIDRFLNRNKNGYESPKHR